MMLKIGVLFGFQAHPNRYLVLKIDKLQDFDFQYSINEISNNKFYSVTNFAKIDLDLLLEIE